MARGTWTGRGRQAARQAARQAGWPTTPKQNGPSPIPLPLLPCEENIPRAESSNRASARPNSNSDRPTDRETDRHDTHSHDVRVRDLSLPSRLGLLTHSLTLFHARFFCPRPCYYGVLESREERGEELSQSTFCCSHYFFGPRLPSLPSLSSLPPTHLPNRIMQRRRKDGLQRCWQHVRPHYQGFGEGGGKEGRKGGREAIFRGRENPLIRHRRVRVLIRIAAHA